MTRATPRTIARAIAFAGAAAAALAAAAAWAGAPQIQSPAPLIHLADNLDEKEQLGWCIDTRGRGFSEHLHAHSCKPRGGDTQFSFDAASGQIRSVAFAGKCMTLNAAGAETVFGLFDCTDGNTAQVFAYDAGSQQIRPAGAGSKCLAAGDASASAGPFMSRSLILADCASAGPALTQWVVVP